GLGRGGGGQLGGLAAGGLGGGLGGGRLGLGGAGGAIGGGGLFAGGGVLAGALLGGGAGALGLLAGGQFDGAAARLLFGGRQSAGVARGRGRTRRGGRLGLRTGDRKSTRLNSSHVKISYAVFCLKKKISVDRVSKATLPLTIP